MYCNIIEWNFSTCTLYKLQLLLFILKYVCVMPEYILDVFKDGEKYSWRVKVNGCVLCVHVCKSCVRNLSRWHWRLKKTMSLRNDKRKNNIKFITVNNSMYLNNNNTPKRNNTQSREKQTKAKKEKEK